MVIIVRRKPEMLHKIGMDKKSADQSVYLHSLISNSLERRINLLHAQFIRRHMFKFSPVNQVRNQKAEKVTYIKGKLLDQAVILFICIPFQNVNFS